MLYPKITNNWKTAIANKVVTETQLILGQFWPWPNFCAMLPTFCLTWLSPSRISDIIACASYATDCT